MANKITKLYLAKLTTNNPSADRTLGIFTEDELNVVEAKWEKN